jgi:hypothetical protein
MDHPRRPELDLPGRLGGADGQGLEEMAWVSHGAHRIDSAARCSNHGLA